MVVGDCFEVTVTLCPEALLCTSILLTSWEEQNAVGGQNCISLCGGYSWPDLLCGVSVDVKM